MLRKVWDVAAKDLLLLSKDRMALLMLFAVPLLLMGILGAAFSGFSSTGPTVTATLPVVDYDGGPLARTLVSALRHTSALTVQIDRSALLQPTRSTLNATASPPPRQSVARPVLLLRSWRA